MDLSWEKVCRPKTWAALTEEEKADVILFANKETFSLEEVRTIIEEQRKYIASRFEGPTTLISNHVCVSRILSSHEYVVNLRLYSKSCKNEQV